MADRRSTSRRELGVWPLVLGAVVVIALAYWFFSDAANIEPPQPTPDSPVATGTVGEPVGSTGPVPQPGVPVGTEVPPSVAPVPTPAPDVVDSDPAVVVVPTPVEPGGTVVPAN